jgi:hypothetical protein
MLQPMERRTALKQLVLLTGTVMLLPACVKNERKVSIALKNLSLSGDQEELLAEITDAIIPATETPGAKELNIHRFIMRMMDDCAEPEAQQIFSNGLKEFEDLFKEQMETSFMEATSEERLRFLKELDKIKQGKGNDEEKKKPVIAFYGMMKDLTVRGYMTSESVMTNQLYFKMVPGKFTGCVEVKNPTDYKTILG